MPELPEVETIRRQLARAIQGKTITRVRVVDARVIRAPAPAAFVRGLRGERISGVERKGKLLIFTLSGTKALCVHLKMTGQLLYPGNGERARVVFGFSDGTQLDFNDQRLFGELRLCDDWRTLEFIQKLGPEPRELTRAQFIQRCAAKKTKIKPLLMDQEFIAGVGNLYAAEALFRARLDPRRPAASLSDKEAGGLYDALTAVLNEAIAHGGSSVDDYVHVDGSKGGYNAYHAVYGKEGKPCAACGGKIMRSVQGGRGTYWCPRCQK
jgi:formamidopyrimidine-DNA glycosylase